MLTGIFKTKILMYTVKWGSLIHRRRRCTASRSSLGVLGLARCCQASPWVFPCTTVKHPVPDYSNPGLCLKVLLPTEQIHFPNHSAHRVQSKTFPLLIS